MRMKHSLLGALAVALLGVVSGCGADPSQSSGQEATGEDQAAAVLGASPTLTLERASTTTLASSELLFAARPPRGELIGPDDGKGRLQINPLDAHLSALALATIKCKGFLDPDDYDATSGMLKPRFQGCPNNEKEYQHIIELLGIQFVNKEAGAYFSRLRLDAQKNFPRQSIPVCPRWSLVQTINPPSFENVKNTPPKTPGKENNVFEIKPLKNCSGAECAVAQAYQCSAGSGSQWWISGDFSKGLATTDPVWWLANDDFAPTSNPFLTPGYFHAMSYYGAVPGSVYGSLHRAGEACSMYYGGYHYKVKLQPVYCSADWICMTQCKS